MPFTVASYVYSFQCWYLFFSFAIYVLFYADLLFYECTVLLWIWYLSEPGVKVSHFSSGATYRTT